MSALSPAPRETALLPPRRGLTRTRVDPFPLRGWLRWLVRLAFAVPYLVVAFVQQGARLDFATENSLVYQHVLGIDWSRADVHWVSELYPPAGMVAATGVSRLIPLGPLGLALLGALVAGYTLQKALEIMRQRRFPLSATVVFMVALAANPFTFYLAAQSTLLFITLALIALGTENMSKFQQWSSTRDGFRAGVYFMLSALTSPIGITLVVIAAVATFFLLPPENRQRGRRRADFFVVAFPTAGAIALWFFLEWAFHALPVRIFGVGVTADNTAALRLLLTTYCGWLLAVPVLSLWLISILARRPSLIVMTLIISAVFLLASFAGFAQDPSVSGLFVLLVTLVVVYTPELRPKTVDAVLPYIAAAQVVMLWLAVFAAPVVSDWIDAVLRTSGF